MVLITDKVIPLALRLSRRNRPYITAEGAQEHLARLASTPKPHAPPKRLRPQVSIAVDRSSGWPGYTLTPLTGSPVGAFVYVHGGGWVNEISPEHWKLAAQVAVEANTTVVVPIYPLIPRGTVADTVEHVVQLVLQTRQRHGTAALGGDSAGGQIALSCAQVLRDQHATTLPRLVLISPALDLRVCNPEIDRVQPHDPWLGREGIKVFADLWRGDLPLEDPRVSPLLGELAGLGPVTVFCGTRDILHPDVRLLVEKAQAAHITIELFEQPGLVHVYPLTPTPRGSEARKIIVQTVATYLRDAP